jgi:hypothetical protein
MPKMPWPSLPTEHERFREGPREYGILPFWFLNGELDPDEMRLQLREFRAKGMPGVILHGRYGLETPYIGETYLDRIRLAVDEARELGLDTWVYDEMNWPSGTADGRVLRARPDLAQRYIECISLDVRGPWFAYLTGADSRYLDFERSTPVAAFALSEAGELIDLTPNLSFRDVIPWEAPPGRWRMIYIVEKRADYYIDALDPEATREYLRIGYDPYAQVLDGRMATAMRGFYTDEPAMHYYLTGGDNPIVPWTKNMFRRFRERCGYELRPRLVDLFYDVSPESARIRFDFYTALSDFYADAYYRQIHEWCRERGVLFTGHLLYEEWLRRMIRVEGNLFKHYRHMDIVGVDHLYPIIGGRDRPDEHVAIKVASSAAHQLGSERLLCESFGGIFMDATMQRMKWVADWEYVLGVNLLNPHGFHYTLEGPRKRDWPPSMFYQYPWWAYYGRFSEYISRLSYLLTGGRHVAKVAIVWPINAMFATYTPQEPTPANRRIEADFNALTDLLLRLHFDFDYVDEDALADADISGGAVHVGDEAYELLVVPPMTHCRLSTVARLEELIAGGGRALGMVMLPARAFDETGTVDVTGRMQALFGAADDAPADGDVEVVRGDHGAGATAFVRAAAIAQPLGRRLGRGDRAPADAETPAGEEARAEDEGPIGAAVRAAIEALVDPDVTISNPDVQYLHRVRDGRDVVFLVNSTHAPQAAEVTLTGSLRPVAWDPSSGEERPIAPWANEGGRTRFRVELPPVGSLFVLGERPGEWSVVETNVAVDAIAGDEVRGRTTSGGEAYVVLERDGRRERLADAGGEPPGAVVLDGEWEFAADGRNALVVRSWLASPGPVDAAPETIAAPDFAADGWLEMRGGAWSYQLPAEPEGEYPVDVWYRVEFEADEVPPSLQLVVDGFAGSDWELWANGTRVGERPVRSPFDSQMQVVELGPLAVPGRNVLAIRLTVTEPTGGLLDLVKILGDFGVAAGADGRERMTAPPRRIPAAPWTDAVYLYLSGRGVYRRAVELPAGFAGHRVFLEAAMGDDVLEVVVNGTSAGVRLWDPYVVELTDLLRNGENTLELRVANTARNLLSGVARPSGLAGPPRLVPQRPVTFALGGAS